MEQYPGLILWAIDDLKTFKGAEAKSRHHHDFGCLNYPAFSNLSAVSALFAPYRRISSC